MISKSAIVKDIIRQLGEELETLAGASRKMHDDASDESNKAEDQYDTRGLETAYLASSQARQATATEEALAAYQSLKLAKFTAKTPIEMTARVEIEFRGERLWYFLGPKGGGIEVGEVMVITPESPIGQEIAGKKVGDKFKFRGHEHRIVSVR
jgi:transcription elongation GreA/GreB family factor